MAKPKTIYSCEQCGAAQPKWQGQCPDCGAWNTLTEQRTSAGRSQQAHYAGSADLAKLNALDVETTGRLSTGLAEFDRVLGGGLVPGSVVLIGGDPGIGKSTLLLQVAARMAGPSTSRPASRFT